MHNHDTECKKLIKNIKNLKQFKYDNFRSNKNQHLNTKIHQIRQPICRSKFDNPNKITKETNLENPDLKKLANVTHSRGKKDMRKLCE